MRERLKSFFYHQDFCEKLGYVFERAAVWTLKALAFFFPIFVLPWGGLPLESMKAYLAVLGILLVLFFALLSALFQKKYIFRFHWIIFAVLGYAAVAAASAIFSESRQTALWGIGGKEMWSVVSIFGLALTTFLIGALSRRKADLTAIVFALAAGIAFAGVLELLQLAGRFPYPFSFARQRIWSPVGTPKSFALLSAFGALIALYYVRTAGFSRRPGVGVMAAILALVVNLAALFRIDFYGAWIFLAAGALLFAGAAVWSEKKSLILERYLPAALFLTGLVFAMIGSPVRQNLIPEFNLDAQTSWSVAKRALAGHWLLGTGPGTFEFSYSLYRPASSNSGNLWNIRFDRPSNHAFAVLATTGILGFLLFLAPFVALGWALWQKVRRRALADPKPFWLATLAFLLFLTAFFIPSNFVLLWYGAAMLGLCVACFGADIEAPLDKAEHRGIKFFGVAFVLIFILWVGVSRVSATLAEPQISRANDAALPLESRFNAGRAALKYNPKEPRAARAFSRAGLMLIDELGKKKALEPERAQEILEEAAGALKQAVLLEPQDVENWLALGAFYQNILPFIEGSGDLATRAYSEALRLEPSNPLPRVEMAKNYITLGDGLKKASAGEELSRRLYQKAEAELIKALELKADYAPAHFFLGLVYGRQGRIKDALLKLESVVKFNPLDAGVAYELGLLYLKESELDKAKAEFSRALQNLPEFSDARWQFAKIFLREGQSVNAIEELEKILRYDADNVEVKKAIERIKQGKNLEF